MTATVSLGAATWDSCITLLGQKDTLVRQQSRHSSVRGETDQLVLDPAYDPLRAVFQEPCKLSHFAGEGWPHRKTCFNCEPNGTVSRLHDWQAADRGTLWGALCLAIPKTALGTEFSEQLLRCMDDRTALNVIKRWLEGA